MSRALIIVPRLRVISLRRQSLPALVFPDLSALWYDTPHLVYETQNDAFSSIIGLDQLAAARDLDNLLDNHNYFAPLTRGVTVNIILSDTSLDIWENILPYFASHFPYSTVALHVIVSDAGLLAERIRSVDNQMVVWRSLIPATDFNDRLLSEVVFKNQGQLFVNLDEAVKHIGEKEDWRPIVFSENPFLALNNGDLVIVDDRAPEMWKLFPAVTNYVLSRSELEVGVFSLRETVQEGAPTLWQRLASTKTKHVIITSHRYARTISASGAASSVIAKGSTLAELTSLFVDELEAQTNELTVLIAPVDQLSSRIELTDQDYCLMRAINKAQELTEKTVLVGVPGKKRLAAGRYPLMVLNNQPDKPDQNGRHYLELAGAIHPELEDIKAAIWQFCRVAGQTPSRLSDFLGI